MNGEVSILIKKGGTGITTYTQWLSQPQNVDVFQQKMYIDDTTSANWNCADAQLLLDTIQAQSGLTIKLYDLNDNYLGNALLTTDSTTNANCGLGAEGATLRYDQTQSSFQIVKTFYFTWEYGSNPDYYWIDLYPDETISQNWQFSDISTFAARGVFSREFRIPYTDRNQQAFDMVPMNNFVDADSLLTSKIDATIFVDDVPLATGFLRVIRVIRKLGTHYDLEISFYGDTPDLFTIIGQKKLYEIVDLPNKDHELTQSYIDNQPDADVLYSLLDRGTNNILSGTNLPDVTLDVAPSIIQQTPSLNWAYIFRQIITDAGFQLDESFASGGWFLMSKLQEIWMPWIDVSPFILPYDEYGLRAHVDTTQTTPAGWYSGSGLNLFVTQASWQVDFDPLNAWTSVGVPPTALGNQAGIQFDVSVYQIRVWATFVWASNNATTITLRLSSQGAGLIFPAFDDVATINIAANSQGTYYISGIINKTFAPTSGGAAVAWIGTQLFLQSTAAWNQGSTQIIAGDPTTLDGTGIQVLSITPTYPSPITTWDVDMKANAPDALQIDFVRDVVQMFNCAIIPDPVIPKKIKFIPMMNYFGADGVDNWTNKLAYDKDIVLRTPIDYLKQKLSFSYAVGGDMNSQLYNTSLKRIYGNYKVDGYVINPSDTPNPFATGDSSIQLTTQSTPCSAYPTSGRIMPRFINNETERAYVPPKMRALYYAGDYLNADGSSYRVLNHYSAYSPEITDFDLNWAPETPLYPVPINPFNNLFTQYWQTYLDSLYDAQGRVMEAYFALEFNDIKEFSFGKYYWIEDCYWRVLSINDYKIGRKELTKVVLLKVVNPQLGCLLTPSGVADDNSITWVDVNNEPADGTEECCRYYRYIWSDTKQKCFDGLPSGGGGGGGGTDVVDEVRFTGSSTRPIDSFGIVKDSDGKISPENELQILVGRDIKVGDNASNTIVVGKEIILNDGVKNSDVKGSNTLATRTGIHFGGGKRSSLDKIGSMQAGQIVLSNGNTFNFPNDQVELYFGLDSLTRLSLEKDTHWMITIDMVATDYAGMWMVSKYSASIWDIGGVIANSNPVQLMIDDYTGTASWELKPAIDSVTSAPEFRIYARLLDLVPYLYPTPPLYIVATISYTQIR